MKARTILSAPLLLLLFFVIVIPALAQSPSPQQTLNQYISDLRKNPNNNALREKIIKLVQEIKPAPAIPEDGERYLVRGAAAFKAAKNVEDFKDAVAEFEKAALAAPWLAETYNNLGVAQDKAGLYGPAIQSLKLYLLAAPDASDAKAVKNLIYEIEYRQEKAAKEAEVKARESSAEALAEKKRKQEAELIKSLSGTYSYSFDDVFSGWGNRHAAGTVRITIRDGEAVKEIKYTQFVNESIPLGVWSDEGHGIIIRGRQFTIKGSVYTISEDGQRIIQQWDSGGGTRKTYIYIREK